VLSAKMLEITSKVKAQLRLLCSIFVISLFAIQTARAAEPATPAFHFVVTGGLMGVSDGIRPFLTSPLFRLKSTSKTGERFVITDANRRAFRHRNTVFLPSKPLSRDSLTKEAKTLSNGVVKGFMGAQLFAIGAKHDTLIPTNLIAEELTRELGSIPVDIQWEIRRLDGVEVLALASSQAKDAIEWPTPKSEVDEVLAVRGRFGSDGDAREYLFFPRQVASTDRVFGVVDSILKADPKAQYIDLGDTLFGPDVEDVEMARKLQGLMLKRKPAVLGAAWHDFRAFWLDAKLMKDAPYVAALSGKEMFPSVRRVENGFGLETIFAALPTSSPLLAMVLPKGTEPLSFEAAIDRVKSIGRKSGKAFVVGLTQDGQSALNAVESPVFDAVLSLVPSKGGALPSEDKIDLSQNKRDGLRSVSPLIRVSSVDVTEVTGFVDESGVLTKLIIKRHAVVDDGVVAADAASVLEDYEKKSDVLAPGLPARSSVAMRGSEYSEAELNSVLGGLLKCMKSGTELAIIDRHDAVTPIESAIPRRLAESLLNDRGRAVWLSIRGKYLKRIFKAIKEDQKGGKGTHFDMPVSVIGGRVNEPTIGQRAIDDNEDYRLVVSERVFFAIDRFMSRESLFAMRNLPSSSLQTALMEGGRDTLKILAEIRKRDSRDNPDIGESRSLFAASFPIADLIEEPLENQIDSEQVTRFIKDSDGKIQPTIIFDVSDLDFGLKFNAVNSVLEGWQDEAKKPGANPGFTEPRFWDPNYSHKLIYAKASVKYIGTTIDAEVGANIKFFQPNSDEVTDRNGNPRPYEAADAQKIRPAKDSVKFEGEVRLPFRRLFDSPPTGFWDLGPVARVTYETQLWPATWLTSMPENLWPHRVNDLRALVGISAKPLASDETLRLGMLFDYDFSRTTPTQSFAYGLEVGGQGKWNIGVVSVKLDSSLRQLFPIATPEASRLGLVWLVDGKVEVPIYGGFSFSMLANTTFGTRMSHPETPGYSVLFAFALSYSDRLKWRLF
jgi:hypothetical protein